MPFTVRMSQVKTETIFDYAFTNIDDIIEQAIFYVDTLPFEVLKNRKHRFCRQNLYQVLALKNVLNGSRSLIVCTPKS